MSDRPAGAPSILLPSRMRLRVASAASAVVSAIAFAVASPLAAQTCKDASFGEWPYLVGNMTPQIGAMVAAAQGNDLDTIYVSVFRATGPRTGSLWITDAAGGWNPAWGPVRPGGAGIDLVALIGQAHAAGLQVVGVVKCFDDTVQPDDAAHCAYLLDVLDYLVRSYDPSGRPVWGLSGIALDYVRFVGTSCGQNAQVVTDFARDVRARLGALALHAYLIANRYTFHGPTYTGPFHAYGAVIASLRSCYGQDWEQLAQWVDVMMPMAYTANGAIYATSAEHEAYVRQVAAYCRTAVQRGGYPWRRVVPAIRCYSDPNETATASTIDASIVGALSGGADGYHAFRYGTRQAAWWPSLRQHAAPGPNRPLADLLVGVQALTATADATPSRSVFGALALQARFDWGDDGTFETAWLANAPTALLARGPGSARLGVQVRDPDGFVDGTSHRLDLPNALSLDVPWLLARTGGAARIQLDCGPAGAGHGYVVAAGLSGSAPGVVVAPGLVLPLNPDGATFALLGLLNTPVLQAGLGTLDAQGRGLATFAVPPAALGPVAWQTLTWAGLGAAPSGTAVFVTNAATLLILP